MSRRIFEVRDLIAGKALLIGLVAASMTVNPALAGRKTRLFTFEEGAVGGTAASATNSLVGPVKDVPDTVFGAPADFYDLQNLNNIADGTLLGDFLAAPGTYDPTRNLTTSLGSPTFVNVANGTPLDSPAQGSNRALRFSGAELMEGPGFRGTFFLESAIIGNQPAVNQTQTVVGNTTFSFTVMSQAWVRPAASGQGTLQAVWAAAPEHGSPRITDAGFWELASLGPAGTATSTTSVAFDQWTHVGVVRTGNGATLYINGSVAATASGFINVLPSAVFLGAQDLSGTNGFQGVIDNFAMMGTAGFGVTPNTDLDYFVDTAITPSGVAGDVDQDGNVSQDDYDIWSTNAGFNNTFGTGDLSTLLKGDVDNNGRIDFFDFHIIAREAASAGVMLSFAVPEPATGVLALAGIAAIWLVRRRHAAT